MFYVKNTLLPEAKFNLKQNTNAVFLKLVWFLDLNYISISWNTFIELNSLNTELVKCVRTSGESVEMYVCITF